jgi:hypothetical protein
MTPKRKANNNGITADCACPCKSGRVDASYLRIAAINGT